MAESIWFLNLTKRTPRKRAQEWFVDETKYLNSQETREVRRIAMESLKLGLARGRFSQVRNWFMIELGLHTGIRVDEMVKLRHQDLFLDNGRSSLRVLGKGSRIRPIWLSSKFLKICSKFNAIKSLYAFSTSGDSFLLNALDGGQISRRALQKFFVQIAQKALPGRKCSIHSLRHTYTTELLRSSGHNYRFAQRQLGHASLRTTQVYAGIVESEGREALEKMYRKPNRQKQE